jgi:hypothetical protein
VSANAAVYFRSSPETYRKHVDPRIRKVLSQADEIVAIGYSLPPYDYDFKTLLASSLMQNRKRKRLHLKLITKGDDRDISALKARFQPFVGKVDVIGEGGFLDYLNRNEFVT